MTSTLLEKTKSKLIEAAKKQYGNEITPCGNNPFTEENGVLFFWFDSKDKSTHIKHTHLIHSN